MKRWILGISGLLLAACGDDDEPREVGHMDASTLPVMDAGGTRDSGPALDASGLDAGVTLCSKYGGAAGVERAIKQYVIEELASDCSIGMHFTLLPANRLARLGDCLAIQAQELFACPGVTYAGSHSPNGLPCRDMNTAHAGLGLSEGDFDALLMDVSVGLTKAGIDPDDIQSLAPPLLGLKNSIVESQVETPSRSQCYDAGVSDAP